MSLLPLLQSPDAVNSPARMNPSELRASFSLAAVFALRLFGLFVVLLYVATGRTGWIAVGLLLAAVGAVAVGMLEPHVHGRVEDWRGPAAEQVVKTGVSRDRLRHRAIPGG